VEATSGHFLECFLTILSEKKIEGEDTCRVARFFLVQNTKTGKNIPNAHKI
jgi:hypothetical protein